MNKDKLVLLSLTILTVVAVGFVLKVAKPVILPLVIAWLMTFIFGPAINFMTQRKIPLPVAITVIMLLLSGVVFLSVFFLHGRVVAIAAEFPRYEEKFIRIGTEIAGALPLAYNPLTDFDWGKSARSTLVTLSGSFFSIVSYLVMVMIFLAFLLSGKPYVQQKMDRALSKKTADQMKIISSSISSQISRYLWAMVLISFLTGCLIWLVLTIIGIDFAITWGALAFFSISFPSSAPLPLPSPRSCWRWSSFIPASGPD